MFQTGFRDRQVERAVLLAIFVIVSCFFSLPILSENYNSSFEYKIVEKQKNMNCSKNGGNDSSRRCPEFTCFHSSKGKLVEIEFIMGGCGLFNKGDELVKFKESFYLQKNNIKELSHGLFVHLIIIMTACGATIYEIYKWWVK